MLIVNLPSGLIQTFGSAEPLDLSLVTSKQGGPQHKLTEKCAPRGGSGEGGGVPVKPVDTPTGHAHLPDLGGAANAEGALDNDGEEAGQDDEGVEKVGPHDGFQSTLYN